MLRPTLIYGALGGGLIIGTTTLALAVFGSEHIATEWFGYLVMLIALSVIFVGTKRYRDHELGGIIRFRTAFALGIGITLVASSIYVAAWELNLAIDDYDFIESYTESVIAELEAEGMAGEELEAEIAEMARLRKRYGNPLYRLPVTFMEIFPVGLLITLASAGLLRDPDLLPPHG